MRTRIQRSEVYLTSGQEQFTCVLTSESFCFGASQLRRSEGFADLAIRTVRLGRCDPGLCEPQVSSALVLRKLALLDRATEAGSVFRRRAVQLRPIDPLVRRRPFIWDRHRNGTGRIRSSAPDARTEPN